MEIVDEHKISEPESFNFVFLDSLSRYSQFPGNNFGTSRPVTNRHQPQPAAEIVSRGLTQKQAAAYCGLSPSAFRNAVRDKELPGPTVPSKRYDRVLLDTAMNQLSGITADEKPLSPLESWRKHNGASKH